MAVTLGRWLLAAALGAAAIAVAVLPYGPPSMPTWRLRVGTHQQQVRRAASAARSQLHRLTRRDAIRDRLARMPGPEGRPVLWLDAGVPEEMARGLRAAWDPFLERLPPTGAGMPAVLYVTPGDELRPTYFLPEALRGKACVALVEVGGRERDWRRGRSTLEWLDDVFGPCSFYAAFGMPGPAVSQWLVHARLEPGASSARTAADGSRRRGTSPLPAAGPRPKGWAALFVAIMEGDELWASPEQAACAAGRPDGCRRFLMLPNEPYAILTGPLDSTGIVKRLSWNTELGFLLSDLVAREGADRFGGFWRSSEGLDSAFRRAFGRPMEEWVAAWVAEATPYRAGPELPWSAWLAAISFVGVVVGAAAAWGTLRQVA